MPATERPDHAEPRAATAPSIVVADDRPFARRGLATVAGTAPVQVVAAVTLAEAVPLVATERPDVLLVGLGARAREPLRIVAEARSAHAGLRVIVVVDSAGLADLEAAVRAGADSVLLSTAGETELCEAIVATAAGDRIVSPALAMQLAGTWRDGRDEGGTASVTPRELEVLQLLAEGMTNQAIAARLGLSARTVKTHVQNLLSKLDVPDRTGAVARGFRSGLIR